MLKKLVSVLFLALVSAAYAGTPTAFDFADATKITSLPYTITKPGSYYLAVNCTYVGSTDAIIIEASQVVLNLNGFSIVASGPAAQPNVGIGIAVLNDEDVTIEGPGDIVGFGAYGVLLDSTDKTKKEHNFKNAVYNVNFDKDEIGVLVVSGSIDVVDQCAFEGGSVGIEDIASLGGDRFEADNFQAQAPSESVNAGIGLLATPGAGVAVLGCLFASEPNGIVLQAATEKYRFNDFNSVQTHILGGTEEGAGDL
jgi:hypothetical protein